MIIWTIERMYSCCISYASSELRKGMSHQRALMIAVASIYYTFVTAREMLIRSDCCTTTRAPL